MRNSVLYAAAAMLIANMLGLITSYALHFSGRLARWLEPVLILPLGASAVTLGLGFVIVFRRAPWDGVSFSILIPFAHALVALPLVVRTLCLPCAGYPDSLRQAAARSARVGRVYSGEVWTCRCCCDRCWSAWCSRLRFHLTGRIWRFELFKHRPEPHRFQSPYIAILSQPGALNYGQALAMSTILLVVCALGSLAIEKARLPGEELF